MWQFSKVAPPAHGDVRPCAGGNPSYLQRRLTFSTKNRSPRNKKLYMQRMFQSTAPYGQPLPQNSIHGCRLRMASLMASFDRSPSVT